MLAEKEVGSDFNPLFRSPDFPANIFCPLVKRPKISPIAQEALDEAYHHPECQLRIPRYHRRFHTTTNLNMVRGLYPMLAGLLMETAGTLRLKQDLDSSAGLFDPWRTHQLFEDPELRRGLRLQSQVNNPDGLIYISQDGAYTQLDQICEITFSNRVAESRKGRQLSKMVGCFFNDNFYDQSREWRKRMVKLIHNELSHLPSDISHNRDAAKLTLVIPYDVDPGFIADRAEIVRVDFSRPELLTYTDHLVRQFQQSSPV